MSPRCGAVLGGAWILWTALTFLLAPVPVSLCADSPASTPVAPSQPKESEAKPFKWKASCLGWSGLRLEYTRKTWLDQWIPEATNSPPLKLAWWQSTNGLSLRLDETVMRARIGGKLALDAAAFAADKQFGKLDDHFEARRIRAYAEGDCVLLLPISYHIEGGYSADAFYLHDSYLSLKNLGSLGTVMAGQFQAPMGMEEVTSSRDISFMELAAAIQALAPGINAGVKAGRPFLDQRATWNLGLFTDGTRTEFGEATKNYGRAIARMTGLPLDHMNPGDADSPQFVHLGASVNFLYAADSTIRYRSRPESHLAPYLLDTGEIAADESIVGALEAAWVSGPFSVQSEYLHSWVNAQDGPALGFDGFYLALSYFLTGESRPYDRVGGRFARIIPQNNFNWGKGGWGAWEIAARYSQLNLSSADVHGGRLSMFMAGLNWYLHPHIKWRFDYGGGHITQSATEGSLHVFQTRFELDF